MVNESHNPNQYLHSEETWLSPGLPSDSAAQAIGINGGGTGASIASPCIHTSSGGASINNLDQIGSPSQLGAPRRHMIREEEQEGVRDMLSEISLNKSAALSPLEYLQQVINHQNQMAEGTQGSIPSQANL